MKVKFKSLQIILIFAILGCLIACNADQSAKNSEEGSGETDALVESATTTDSPEFPTFAVVAYDQVGDRGYVDMAVAGMEKAAEDFDITYKLFACNSDQSVALDTIKTAAENYDVIILVAGFVFDVELEQVKQLYPDKTYVYFDGVSSLEGVKSVTFAQNEGAFLAGVLAANLTTDTSVSEMINEEKIVGFVGGADMPVIRDYQAGYEHGVRYVDPSMEVVVKYAGDHFDPAKGKVTAFNTYNEGADVIFQAAGPTGLGVLEAAETYKFLAIGVDTDQSYIQPNYIISSMLKRVDTAIYDVVSKTIAGEELDAVSTYNVANGGISLAKNEYFESMVPDNIKEKILDAEQKIINGEIVVESYQ
ncbi:MAG: BMP family ABC transporter substrate-binding protein [Candidatus Methanofastidiosa archaeon]|nr:BMP family ABC transporter substrate-binding protein [Candidatus Methanofastidiosa archaeon]